MKCKDCEAICSMRDKSSAGERECAYQAQIIARPDQIDWFNFRCVAAKDILVALVAKSGSESVPDINLVVGAIGMADILIEQLKGEE